MRILHIIPNLKKGGAERIALDICRELANREDIYVKLVTLDAENGYQFLSENVDWEVVSASVIPSISRKNSVDVGNLQRSIDDFAPDIIHTHLFKAEMTLSGIKYQDCSYFVHFHDNMIQFKKFSVCTLLDKGCLTNYYERKMVLKQYHERCPEFIAISQNSFDYLNENVPRKFHKHLLHNAIKVSRFATHRNLGDGRRLITIGSLVDKKGHDLAIEVIKVLRDRGTSVFLDVLGDGVNYDRLLDLAKKKGLGEQVIMHGNVDYPENFLGEASVYLHTARYEPFGLVLIEAMAAGLPVVCTDAIGNRDLIHEGKNGYMVRNRDASKLADKVELLIKNDNLRSEMSKNACAFAQNFDIADYVDKLLEIYSASLGR